MEIVVHLKFIFVYNMAGTSCIFQYKESVVPTPFIKQSLSLLDDLWRHLGNSKSWRRGLWGHHNLPCLLLWPPPPTSSGSWSGSHTDTCPLNTPSFFSLTIAVTLHAAWNVPPMCPTGLPPHYSGCQFPRHTFPQPPRQTALSFSLLLLSSFLHSTYHHHRWPC